MGHLVEEAAGDISNPHHSSGAGFLVLLLTQRPRDRVLSRHSAGRGDSLAGSASVYQGSWLAA